MESFLILPANYSFLFIFQCCRDYLGARYVVPGTEDLPDCGTYDRGPCP